MQFTNAFLRKIFNAICKTSESISLMKKNKLVKRKVGVEYIVASNILVYRAQTYNSLFNLSLFITKYVTDNYLVIKSIK